MKLTVEQTDLAVALARVVGIVGRRNTVPILSNVLLEAAGGTLTIKATDLDMEATVTAACAIGTKGRTTVPGATLYDIARSLPAGAQLALAIDGERLAVSSGRSRWKLPTLPADQFPALKPEDWSASVLIKGADLADVLTRTAWCVTNDVNKQNGHGVNIGMGAGKLTACAWRGPQLVVATCAADAEHESATIPAKMVAEIIKACADRGAVTLAFSDRKVGVSGDGWSITSKLIGLPFVEYLGMVNIERSASFAVDRSLFAQAIKRAMITADDVKDAGAVRLALDGGTLTVTSRASFSEGADEIEIEYDGPTVAWGVSGSAMIEMLTAIRGQGAAVIAFVPDASTPISVRGADDDSVVAASGTMRVGA